MNEKNVGIKTFGVIVFVAAGLIFLVPLLANLAAWWDRWLGRVLGN